MGMIKSTALPKAGIGGTWSAEIESDSSQGWADGAATLTLSYIGTFHSFDPYAFRVGFSPVLRGELATAIPLEQLIEEWIRPIHRFLSIATGRAEALTYAAVCLSSEDVARPAQIFGAGVTQ